MKINRRDREKARRNGLPEYSVRFLNMEKLIQCKNGPEPLKSKGLRDLSQFSAVVLIVEKGWISWRSRQIGAYQHTKPNSHTIPESSFKLFGDNVSCQKEKSPLTHD